MKAFDSDYTLRYCLKMKTKTKRTNNRFGGTCLYSSTWKEETGKLKARETWRPAWDSVLKREKERGTVSHAFNLNTWGTDVGRSLWIRDQFSLYSKFQVNLDPVSRRRSEERERVKRRERSSFRSLCQGPTYFFLSRGSWGPPLTQPVPMESVCSKGVHSWWKNGGLSEGRKSVLRSHR